MKNLSTPVLAFMAITAMMSCNGRNADKQAKTDGDSSVAVTSTHEDELTQLQSALAAISSGLDDIAVQENLLFADHSNEGNKLSKSQILSKLDAIADVIAVQRKKMAQLQETLSKNKSANSTAVAQLQQVVSFLNKQLAEKDEEIKSLQVEVKSKNQNITQLNASLKSMRQKAEKAEKREQVLKEALITQDEVVNQCYIRVGTKKELKAAGLLNTGILRKKRVNYQSVEKSKFQSVDIRHTRRIKLNSDNPHILTPMPSSRSFHFEEIGDGSCELVITDPTRFWSVSNFLIIQL